jgi:subtilisin
MVLMFGVEISEGVGKPIRMAVLDTGINNHISSKVRLCADGHKDFTTDSEKKGNTIVIKGKEYPRDVVGHGTNVVNLIAQNVGDANYCIVVVKYFSKNAISNLGSYNRALKYLSDMDIDFLNISSTGNIHDMEEEMYIKKILDKNVVIIASAGNDGEFLGDIKYYPAMVDKRIVVVGSLDKRGNISTFSNYGPDVDAWELGEGYVTGGISFRGTSQSTAVHSGKLILKKYEENKGIKNAIK